MFLWSLKIGISAKAGTLIAAVIAISGLALPRAAFAEIPQIAAKQRAEKKTFTDAQISDGFFKAAFGAEYHLAGRVDRIRKYEAPVRVFIEGSAPANRVSQLGEIIGDIARRIRHIDIAQVKSKTDANVVVTLVRDRDLNRTIEKLYGTDRAREIKSSLDPQCLSGFSKNDAFQILRSEVLLTIDNGDFVFHDCGYEELLQSLGPINDTDVPWTMFNDDVSLGFFGVYDQHLMNILYDPRIKAGMTIQQAKDALPAVLKDVREWVAKTNNLPQQ